MSHALRSCMPCDMLHCGNAPQACPVQHERVESAFEDETCRSPVGEQSASAVRDPSLGGADAATAIQRYYGADATRIKSEWTYVTPQDHSSELSTTTRKEGLPEEREEDGSDQPIFRCIPISALKTDIESDEDN
jgi:hypothetical protein